MQKARKKMHTSNETLLHDFLRKVPLFDTLHDDEMAVVEKHITIFELDQGDFLFKERQAGDSVCFLLSGSLAVIKQSDSNMVEIATLSKGCTVGEMSIVGESKRSATVKARQTSSIASLSLEDFENILEKYPKIGVKVLKALLKYLSMNMRRTSKRLAGYMEDYMSLLFYYRKQI